jgi:cysteinyl-tRNA synthetase
MHVGHVNINDEKMSKSLNNFILVKDILTKYTGNDIRWFMYQSRYESPLNYTDELLENATIGLTKVLQQINHALIQMFLNDHDTKLPQSQPHIEFIDALNDDLDFPRALTIIYDQSKGLSNLIKPKNFDQLAQHIAILISELEILGIKYINPINDEVLKSIIIE